MRSCVHCNAPLENDAVLCNQCGQAADGQPSPTDDGVLQPPIEPLDEPPAPEKPRVPLAAWISAGVAVLAACGVLLAAIFMVPAINQPPVPTVPTMTEETAMIVDDVAVSRESFMAHLFINYQYMYQSGLYQYEYYGLDMWEMTFSYGDSGEKLPLADYLIAITKDEVRRSVAVEKLMAQYGITLSQEDIDEVAASVKDADAEDMASYGFDKQTYIDACLYMNKAEQTLFYTLYGEGGAKAIPAEELSAFYADNFVSAYCKPYYTESMTDATQAQLADWLMQYQNGTPVSELFTDSERFDTNTLETDEAFIEMVKGVTVGEGKIVPYTDKNNLSYTVLVVRMPLEEAGEEDREMCMYGLRFEEFDAEIETLADSYAVQYNDSWFTLCDPQCFDASQNEEEPDLSHVGTVSTVTPTHYAEITVEHYGTIKVALDANTAPITVQNFIDLSEQGFYNGLTFHRIIEGFMMQGGDPNGNGSGGSENTIKGEFAYNGVDNPLSHVRGAISMARSNAYDSASSQFFIVHQNSTSLDGQYAVFGYVVEGMEIVDAICEAAEPTDNNGTIPAEQQPVIDRVIVYAAE